MNDALRLRVVGSSPAMPRPGSACSSYLLQAKAAAVVLDLGNGALAKLQLATGYTQVDAIVISHMHPDHFFDLVPLRYGLKYGPAPRTQPLPLWLPPNGMEKLIELGEYVSGDRGGQFFDEVYSMREYDPDQPLTIGGIRLRFRLTRHFITAFAIRAECGGASITYSADTAPCDAVVELAGGSSIFLCEAALGLDMEEGERGHSSAEEAGEMARRAGVARLVLTHYSTAYSPDALVAAAKHRFSGPVELAIDGLDLTVISGNETPAQWT
jgi:ribonuclease BN (tRNA processing enzyme)